MSRVLRGMREIPAARSPLIERSDRDMGQHEGCNALGPVAP